MPQHLEAHWAAGGQIWGRFWLRHKATISRCAEELYMIWETSETTEWVDVVDWIPF